MGVHTLISGVEQQVFGSFSFSFRSLLTITHTLRPQGRTASLCKTGKCVTFVFNLAQGMQALADGDP